MKRKEEKKEKKKQHAEIFLSKKSGEKSTKFNERNSVLLVKLKHLTQHTTPHYTTTSTTKKKAGPCEFAFKEEEQRNGE
jgi:hypothetical protein